MKHPTTGSGGKGSSQRSVDKTKHDENFDNIKFGTLKPSKVWEKPKDKKGNK